MLPEGVSVHPNLDGDTELRTQWKALLEANALHELPVEALVASIKDLANELLARTSDMEFLQVGWFGPYGIVPGGMDNEPYRSWRPVYVQQAKHD